MQITIADISIQVTKKNIKNMHLYVKPPDGHVEVSVPMHLSDESITLFIRTKLGWIRAQRKKFDMQERQTERQYISGETLFVLGKRYYLHVVQGGRSNSLELKGDDAILTVRKGSTSDQREAWVNEWYREILKKQVEKLLPKWETITGLHPSSWQTKNMTTRWGTCNTATGKIWLNLQLAKKPPECIEYVILHELAHLKVKNHGKDFIAILDGYMPYWRETRKLLNEFTLDYMPSGKSYVDD